MTSGEFATAPGGFVRVRVGGGTGHVHGDEARGALAVGGHLARKALAHPRRARLRSARRRACPVRRGSEPGGTALAAGHHEARIVRGGVGIDGDLVEAPHRRARLSTAWRSRGSTGASVARTAIIVAMFGMIMPEPFVMPPTEKTQPS